MAFTNLDQVFKAMENIIIQQLEKVGEDVKEELKDRIKKYWYGRPGYSPDASETDFYRRTFSLINSIKLSTVRKFGNTYEIEVYFNYGEFDVSPGENGYWSQHSSIIDGSPFIYGLVETILNGRGNPSRLYGWSGTHIMEDTKDLIKKGKWLLTAMKQGLISKGFRVK